MKWNAPLAMGIKIVLFYNKILDNLEDSTMNLHGGKRWITGLLVLGLAAITAHAYVKPHSLFTDNMVLQRGMAVPVWGWADDGESVTVEFMKQKVSTQAENGKWMVRLKSLKAGGPSTMTIQGKNTVTLHNVLVGDVWMGSGQSNMQFAVQSANNATAEIRTADYPRIRLYDVPRVVAGKPQETVDAVWKECNPNTVPGFSAALFYFGRYLHQALDVPIGLVHTSWGGTPAESWTTWETLAANDDFRPIVDRWEKSVADYHQNMSALGDRVRKWMDDAEAAEDAGKPVPANPKIELPQDPRRSPWRPAGLYNQMIAPLIPYAIKGAIWYQGESNAGRSYQYRTLFPAMIQDWRKQWGQGDFPFFFVQLANFQARRNADPPWNSGWAELREAQSMTLSLPKTGMAVIIDIGEARDIHPRNKQDVGKRLALSALKVAYGENIPFSGPIYKSMNMDKNSIRLQFDYVYGGLMTPYNEKLKGFWIAGEDKQFVAADAEIDGKSVVVHSSVVSHPTAVRYGWEDNPDCNLYNDANLPASPFRTDDWEGVTLKDR